MSSIKKLDANRRNALKSTGPKTEAGKAAVSKNAIKNGLLSRWTLVPGESEEALELLSRALRADLEPVGAVEELLVDNVVSLVWRLRRVGRVEAGIFASREEDQAALNAAEENLEKDHREERGLLSTESMRRKFAGAIEEKREVVRGAKDRTALYGRAFIDYERAFGTLNRYEQPMRRDLYRALHELERVQARRKGFEVAPPTAVDVTLDGHLTEKS